MNDFFKIKEIYKYTPELGLPYMGSKRKIAKNIVDFILKENPNCEYVYDLFGGGGAISFDFIQRPQIKKVFYNDLNTGIVRLLEDIRDNGVTDKYYNWVDRETFNKHKYDKNWFGGLLQTCWSFGNNQKQYLFSKENEIIKKEFHNLIVYKDKKVLKKIKDTFNLEIPEKFLDIEDLSKRRKIILRYIINKTRRRNDLQQLERLQQLEQLEQLELSNISYENVEIKTPINKTIIYLDPPYKNTAKYQEDVDYKLLWDYIRSSSYKVYLSSYEASFKEVFSIEKYSLLSSINKSKKVYEKLYTNF